MPQVDRKAKSAFGQVSPLRFGRRMQMTATVHKVARHSAAMHRRWAADIAKIRYTLHRCAVYQPIRQ